MEANARALALLLACCGLGCGPTSLGNDGGADSARVDSGRTDATGDTSPGEDTGVVDSATDSADARDGGVDVGADARVDPGSDAGTPRPDSGPPACTDSRGTGAVLGPAGIMIQSHTAGDLCLLERALDHICRAHRAPGSGRIADLVLTDAVQSSGGRPTEELNTEVLDRVMARRSCFDNLFIGTIPEVILPDPYSTATITNPDRRWEWIRAAARVADQVAAYMARVAPGYSYNWYVSYEANLNYFTDATYRSAYVALLDQHVRDVLALRGPAAVFWSPTFWTDPAGLGASARSSLSSAIGDFFRRVPGITWVAVQDHVGVSSAFSCADALVYYQMVRSAAPALASVQMNIEYFDATGSGIRPGDPAELARRVACYNDAGARLGASFDFRYWYETHGH